MGEQGKIKEILRKENSRFKSVKKLRRKNIKVFFNFEKYFYNFMKGIIWNNVEKQGRIKLWKDLDISLNLDFVVQNMRFDKNV